MKKLILSSLLFALLMALLAPTACYYDNEEDLYGIGAGCDTTNMRYSTEIKNLMVNNCYSCHSVSNNVAGSPFDTYETLKNYVDNGLLIQRMNDIASPMPPNGLLSDCDRRKVQAWVAAGAPNN